MFGSNRPNAHAIRSCLSSELEHQSRLIPEIILIVMPGREVVDESGQKIIRFDGPDRQVGRDLDVEPSPQRHRQSPIARRAGKAIGAILVDILVKIGMRAADQPLKKRLHPLDTNFYLRPETPREQICRGGPAAARGTPYAAGRKAEVDVLARVSFYFRLQPEKTGKIKHRRSASPVQVDRREIVDRHVTHVGIVGRQFSKVLAKRCFSEQQQNESNQNRSFHV
jgi:hypothetical protein